MELHAMYLKSKGAMVARTLSYEGCEFEAVNNAMSKEMEHVYNQSTDLWKEMHVALLNAFDERRVRAAFEQKMNKKIEMGRPLEPEEKRQQEIYADSDDEDDYDSLTEQEALYRRKCRNRPAHILKGVFWGSHQRYFRSLCISSKIDRCIETVNQSLADGPGLLPIQVDMKTLMCSDGPCFMDLFGLLFRLYLLRHVTSEQDIRLR